MEKKFEASEYNQKIRLYINKQMGSDELIIFENEMNANQELANEVKAQRFQNAFNYLKLKTEINEVRASLENEVIVNPVIITEPKLPFLFIFPNTQFGKAMAAVLLIALIGAGSWFGINQYQDYQANIEREKTRKDSLQRIEEQNQPQIVYNSNTNDLINSAIGDSKLPIKGVPSELNDVVIRYERAETKSAYSQVAQELKPRGVNPPPKDYDPDEMGGVSSGIEVEENAKIASYRAFYHGLSLLALEKYDAGIRRFNAVKINDLANEVQWYKALTYLKKGDKSKGNELLRSIANSNSKFKTQAQELMDSMKNNE